MGEPGERREHQEWHQSWGNPTASTYLSLAEINEGFALIAELRSSMPASGELAAFFGWHPPSFFHYAFALIDGELDKPASRTATHREFSAAMWMDGVLVGMAVLLLMFGGGDRPDR